MFFLLLAGTYAVLLPLGFGIWAVRLLRIALGLKDSFPIAALAIWLSGIMLLTSLLEIVSLVGPIHTAAHVGALVIGISGLAQPAGKRLLAESLHLAQQWHWLAQLLAMALLVYSLLIGTMPSPNIDTGIYHAQSLRWLEELGIVPGLANAEIHIGFNSAWFLPEALFSWGRYLGSPLQVLNPVFFVLFGWYCLAGLNRLLSQQASPADMVRLPLLLLMFRLTNDIASLSPDPAIALLLFFIVLQALELPLARPLNTSQVLVTLLCVFAITIKLSVLPILLLPAWWAAHAMQPAHIKQLFMLGAFSLTLVAPWIVRNILISGYLIFPVEIDLFTFRWKFPLAEMHLQSAYIKEFARNTNFYGKVKVLNTPLQHWLPIWWRQQFAITKSTLLTIVALLLIGPPLGWYQYRRGILSLAPQLLLAFLLTLAGVIFWFVLAPAPRFGHGFLFSMLALLALPCLWLAARYYSRLLLAAVTFTTIALMIVSPLQMHYSYYYIPNVISQAEYRYLAQQLPAPADRSVLRNHYSHVAHDSLWATPKESPIARARLIVALARVEGLPGRSGLDGTGRSGFLGLSQLIRPASYPVIAVQHLQLGAVQLLQSKQNQHPWYAPFPFVARPKLCRANGPLLRDGFRPRVVANIRDWAKEGHW